MNPADRLTTAALIELVRQTRKKVKDAAHDLEELTLVLRKRLEESDD